MTCDDVFDVLTTQDGDTFEKWIAARDQLLSSMSCLCAMYFDSAGRDTPIHASSHKLLEVHVRAEWGSNGSAHPAVWYFFRTLR